VNALANEEVGEYLNAHFVSTFQKVGTFRIVGGQKQGGNVASYFCTPDGGILHAVAGPVDATSLLREARWAVETRKMALLESRGNVTRYKQTFRMAHVEQLPSSPAAAGVNWSRLPFVPPSAESLSALLQREPLARSLDKQGRVHLLLAVYPLVKLDQAYKVIYRDIVGEEISTNPVVDGSGGTVPNPSVWSSATASPGGTITSPLLGRPLAPSREAVQEEQTRQAALRQACERPEAAAVRSGAALNIILEDLMSRDRMGAAAADNSPRLDAEVLAHINVVPRDGGRDYGLLRDGGTLRWPPAWEGAPLGEPSQALRQSVQSGIREALGQGKKGRVPDAVLNQLHRDFCALEVLLDQNFQGMTPSAYIRARKYLKLLEDAQGILSRGDLALDPQKIHTVSELVAFMSEHGLKFAAAGDGDESAYTALHQALAKWDRSQSS
jgi:hypothetical protein